MGAQVVCDVTLPSKVYHFFVRWLKILPTLSAYRNKTPKDILMQFSLFIPQRPLEMLHKALNFYKQCVINTLIGNLYWQFDLSKVTFQI